MLGGTLDCYDNNNVYQTADTFYGQAVGIVSLHGWISVPLCQDIRIMSLHYWDTGVVSLRP